MPRTLEHPREDAYRAQELPADESGVRSCPPSLTPSCWLSIAAFWADSFCLWLPLTTLTLATSLLRCLSLPGCLPRAFRSLARKWRGARKPTVLPADRLAERTVQLSADCPLANWLPMRS